MLDFAAALTQMADSVPELQASFVMRDGLVVQAYPEDGPSSVKKAWMSLAVMGDFAKVFLIFQNEAWVCVQRGSWGVCAVALPGARAGLLLDLSDQLLDAVEKDSKAVAEERVAVQPARQPAPWTRVPEEGPQPVDEGAEGGRRTLERRPRPVSWIRAPQAAATPTPAKPAKPRPETAWIQPGHPEAGDGVDASDSRA